MQRNYQSCPYSNSQFDLTNQMAFHEAGHAVSIYLGNKAKQLPPVYFQIQINKPVHSGELFIVNVTNGQLIQSLPIAGLNNAQLMTCEERLMYQLAYEADIVNLLVGPLAEAKYVSLRDDEALDFNLLNTYALNYYGGSSDVKKAYSYLEYFMSSEAERENKMFELFSEAFEFISNKDNWECIPNLAHYILESNKGVVNCEEAIAAITQPLCTENV